MQLQWTVIFFFSGSWTSYAPSCILIDCGEPLPLDNGRVYKLNSTTINSVIEHHCLPGFERDGPFERVCLEDGYWSGVEPSCQKPRPVLTIFRYIQHSQELADQIWALTQFWAANHGDIGSFQFLEQQKLQGYSESFQLYGKGLTIKTCKLSD